MKLRIITLFAVSLNVFACGDDASTGMPSGSGGMSTSTGSGGASGSAGALPSAGGSAGAANPGSGGSAGAAPSGGAGGKADGSGGAASSGGTAGMPGNGGAAGSAGANTAGSGGAAGSSGAAGAAGSSGGSGPGGFNLTSTVVSDGQMIPKDYRCQNPSPPLGWTAGPSGTLSYAIVLKDVTKPQQIVMHWVIYDIPGKEMGLPEHMPSGATLMSPASPVDAKQGPNYSGMRVYAGPCAPSGTNMYKFTLYALDVATLPGVPANANATQIETALEGSHKLATAVLNITSMP